MPQPVPKPTVPLEGQTLSELQTLHKGLTSLNSLPEWDLYREFLQTQIESRKNNIAFTPLATVDGTLAQEFAKGEISGIFQSAFLLTVTIEAYAAEIKDRIAKQDKEDA